MIAELLDAYHINSELASETSGMDTGTKQDSFLKGLKGKMGRTAGHAAKGAGNVLHGMVGGCGKILQACRKAVRNLAVFLWKGLKAFAGWFGKLFLSIWHFFTGMFKSIGTLFQRKEKHPERSADSLSSRLARGGAVFYRWCGRVCRGCLRLCLKACLF